MEITTANVARVLAAIASAVLLPGIAYPQMPAGLYYIHVDHLNTPRAIYNQQQQLVWRWDQQEPFGHSPPNESPSGLGTFECHLRFPGQYFDKETNLAYNYFRDFDPGLGRYAQSDPIGLEGGANAYGYVNDNPLSWIDQFGLDAVAIVFPDYMVQTPIGRQPLGHAGVLLIDPTGATKYYEYGRYADNNCQCGSVRNPPVPPVKIGANGRPTRESLQGVLGAISRQSGQGGRILGAYVPNDYFTAMNDYALIRRRENSNRNRTPYDLFNRNCGHFMLEVIRAGGVGIPATSDPRPTNMIQILQGIFGPTNFTPR